MDIFRNLIVLALFFMQVGHAFIPSFPLSGKVHSANTLQMSAEEGKGKIALVTGASRGIGKSIALKLAEEGCRVVVNYAANTESAQRVVREIVENGGQAVAIKADVSKKTEVDAMFKEAKKFFQDTPDILVNNAGITRDGLVLRMKQKDWTDVIDLNLSGVFYCTQAASKFMMKKRSGRIINIASIIGLMGNPGQANYAAAKSGVISLTYTCAKEFASRGINVNAICPGFIESDMTHGLDVEGIKRAIPKQRLGKPEEIAGMVHFLALDEAADYVNGQILTVDGGLTVGGAGNFSPSTQTEKKADQEKTEVKQQPGVLSAN
mmetsp:Transcript_6992/g.9375  ORF Transcript_6992/g.9375 Transcript_6992/m.9375 type:complete len:321 (-) Transcript_6992:476-1438(-)|eukprot:CAMPEP_0117755436 /NCGR_PEP_ID=MMETSP0947-20121206/13452_1 /TAXON_ID=44440 /ORGANISM="Chattonella subsalsa, Strain CCMP2191" /LENGTH=320 /DNA_ID=CAMNT_0005574773 /DNA_START=88 /DNA_END=1050 /DNA_ORIENTATION=-